MDRQPAAMTPAFQSKQVQSEQIGIPAHQPNAAFRLQSVLLHLLETTRIKPGDCKVLLQETRMTGDDLHQLILNKWGYSFDVQLRRVQGKVFFQVMWKYLEQASFPMSEAEYFEHLNDIAQYLNAWGSSAQVQDYIEQTSDRPRLGKAVSIPLDLGDRASEWMLE